MASDHSSLGACSDCGGLVSRQAMMCPHCGRPFGTGPQYAVTVRDVKMRFWSMVLMLVSLAFASIPAMLIVITIGLAISGFLTGLFHLR